MFDSIVCATDGSELAEKALLYARNLSKLHKAKLFIVHAYDNISDLVGYKQYTSMAEHRIARGQEILDQAMQTVDFDEISVETELLEGPMAEAIIAVANTRHVDLIVIGARGVSSLQGLLLGSVSQKVIQHAHCPVLVVR